MATTPTVEQPPRTFRELFALYYDRYKPLHARIQLRGSIPVELLHEIAAAWDHISRHWQYDADESQCVDRAAGHLKRAVFDAYKLELLQTTKQYDELLEIDTSLIDNGKFDLEMRGIMHEIEGLSILARTGEGNTSGSNGWNEAFEAWAKADEKMQQFGAEFYRNPHIEWARRKSRLFTWKAIAVSFIVGLLSSAVVSVFFC